MNVKENKHGGKRSNAGRKPKYKEPTKTVSFRIPISFIDEFKKRANWLLGPKEKDTWQDDYIKRVCALAKSKK